MAKWSEKKLKYNQAKKSLKEPFATYLDLECFLKKEQSHSNNNNNNNIEESYAEKKAKHEPSGWSLFTRCSFDGKENKLNFYRGKDYIEKLCKKLKESAREIINREKKEMVPLTHGENNFYDQQEILYICKGKFCMDEDDENCTNRKKAKDHCHYTGKFRGAAHSKCNLNYNIQKEILC